MSDGFRQFMRRDYGAALAALGMCVFAAVHVAQIMTPASQPGPTQQAAETLASADRDVLAGLSRVQNQEPIARPSNYTTRPLLRPDRSPVGKLAVAETRPQQPTSKPRLFGIVSLDGTPHALVGFEGSKENQLYKVGDPFEDWLVYEIRKSSIQLRHRTQDTTLDLPLTGHLKAN